MDRTEQHVLGYVFEQEISLRWIDRRWYRKARAQGRYLDLETENVLILRALLKLRGQVRRAAKAAFREQFRKSEAIDRLVDGFIEPEDWDDPMPPDLNREGDPTLNGAFR